jgi:predicted O-linked N-acetylglucosamine transferase (SPINDLY family)
VDNAVFQRAMAALQTRNLTDAERLFKDVLRAQPKLERNRTASALFDTVRFTRNIEAAYVTMRERR